MYNTILLSKFTCLSKCFGDGAVGILLNKRDLRDATYYEQLHNELCDLDLQNGITVLVSASVSASRGVN